MISLLVLLFQSAAFCGGCHGDIHQGWKGSMHANSMADPVFTAVFHEVSGKTGGKKEAFCLSCHAPTTRITKDFRQKLPITREGITCDFCHSVAAVRPDAKHREGSEPFVIRPGRTKWGPLNDPKPSVHEARYADHFEKAEFCAGCHQLENERGIEIFGTYSEWKAGPLSKEGKVCQNCHMPRVQGEVIRQQMGRGFINKHEAAGGHSVEQVKKAVAIRIKEVSRTGGKIHAVVELENVGSGHKVPTGLPTRKVVLDFRAISDGDPIFSRQVVYQRRLADRQGKAIVKDSDIFLNAYSVLDDNRLAPRRPREEHFEFIVPEGRPVEIEAELTYLYEPSLYETSLYEPEQVPEMAMRILMGKVTQGVSAN